MRNTGQSGRWTAAIGVTVVAAIAVLVRCVTVDPAADVVVAGDEGAAAEMTAATAAGDGTRVRDAAPPVDGSRWFAAPAGSEFGYEFVAVVRSGVEVALAGQPAVQSMVLRLHGPLHVLVVARRGDELIARVDLAGVTADLGVGGAEQHNPALAEVLALPVSVRMRDDGAVLGFAFDQRSNGFVKNLVRSIVCGFRFVVPVEAGRQLCWTGEEADPTGIATVRYEWLGDPGDERGVRRTKTGYRAAPGQRSDLPLSYEVRSVAQARLSSELGWLRSAQLGETLTACAETASLRSTTAFEASLELTAHTLHRLTELPVVYWDRPWAGLDGIDDTNAIAASSERELSELELGGATLASLLLDIQSLTAAAPIDTAALVEASHRLAIRLRLHPEELEQLRAVLPTSTPLLADVVLGAVGAAGTAAAQQLLAGLAGDAAAAANLRRSALDSMIQLAAPDDAVLAAVRNLADDPAASPALRNKSLLVLGALASRQPQSDTIDRGGLVAELLAREDRARSAGQLEHWLHALGNSGHPDTLPAIERCLTDAAVAVRHAAVAALRRVETAPATSALLDRARSEPDQRVRALAIEELAQRSDQRGLDYIDGVLAREPNAEVRRAAVAGLSRQLLQNDAVRPLLQRTAQNDPARTVRDEASRALLHR